MMNEQALIALIKEQTGCSDSGVKTAIGDDAAVVSVPAGKDLVISTDTSTEGVHFLESMEPRDIGWRSFAAAASDLAAMAATPSWSLFALSVPEKYQRQAPEIIAGITECSRQCKLPIIGGDTTGAASSLSLTVTVAGYVDTGRAVMRSTAQIGDIIAVTGTLGAAAAGLIAYRQGQRSNEQVGGYLHPIPRIPEALELEPYCTSLIDISDGLYIDLGHLIKASGVGAQLSVDQLPLATVWEQLDIQEKEQVRYTLMASDDYQLCCTIPAQVWKQQRPDAGVLQKLNKIGHITNSDNIAMEVPATWSIDEITKPMWQHF